MEYSYAITGTINTSDRNEKKDICELNESVRTFIADLKPVKYKFNDGARFHYGLIAQDVEETMNKLDISDMDFAGFIKSPQYNDQDEREIVGYSYGLRYSEFIAPLIKTVQLQQKEIDQLKERIDALEQQVNAYSGGNK